MNVPPTLTPVTAVPRPSSRPQDGGQTNPAFDLVLNKEISHRQSSERNGEDSKSGPAPGKCKTPESDPPAGCRRREASALVVGTAPVVSEGHERLLDSLGDVLIPASPEPPLSSGPSTHEETDTESCLPECQDLLASVSAPIILVAHSRVASTPKPALSTELDAMAVTGVARPSEDTPVAHTRLASTAAETADKTFASTISSEVAPEAPKRSAPKTGYEAHRQDASETGTVTADSPVISSLPVTFGPESLESLTASNATTQQRDAHQQPQLTVPAVEFPPLTPMPLELAVRTSRREPEMLQPRVGTNAWETALGQRVCWMIGDQQHTASLLLDPPELGLLQVVVTVSNDQATATFVAAEPEVRRAIEAAIPRLREMMDSAGIQLGDATVSAGTSSNDNSPPSTRHVVPIEATHGQDQAQSVPGDRTEVGFSRGLVDTFA